MSSTIGGACKRQLTFQCAQGQGKKGNKGNLSNEDNLDLPESGNDSDLDHDSEPAHALAPGTLIVSRATPPIERERGIW